MFEQQHESRDQSRERRMISLSESRRRRTRTLIGYDDDHHIHVTAVTIARRISTEGAGPHRASLNAAPLSNTPAAALCAALPVCPRWRRCSKEGELNVCCCAGFRTPATTSYRHAAEAGVRKAPRHEIAGSRPRSAVPQAQLWGFERRTCRVRASARREVERLRREKQAGGFALSAARPEKRGSSGYLLGERRICAS
jgi:hypothetical protein